MGYYSVSSRDEGNLTHALSHFIPANVPCYGEEGLSRVSLALIGRVVAVRTLTLKSLPVHHP